MKKFPLHPAKRTAFTLIELLVVIGIIAVLAGLIFSVVPQVSDAGKRTAAMGNLRQTGAAVLVYTADKGHYPPATDGVDWRGYWSDALTPYLGLSSWWGDNTPGIFDSPAKSIPTDNYVVAFTVNPNVMQDMLWGGGETVRMARVQRPAETLLMADGVQKDDGWLRSPHMWEMPGIYDSNPENANQAIPVVENLDNGTAKIRFPHDNRAMVLFADGHVDYRRNGELLKRNFVIEY